MSASSSEAWPTAQRRLHWAVAVLVVLAFAVGLVMVALPLLGWTYHRFRLTELVYGLIAAHAVVLMVGGHYTYAEVPLGFWLQDLLGAARNHYDRIGHLFQGLVPALVAREVLLRRGVLVRGGWCFFLVTCVCLPISA